MQGPRWVRLASAGLLAISAFGASGQPAAPKAVSIPPPPDCLDEAANFHRINPWVLRAIIWHESRNNPTLVLKNTDGSHDVGYGGINSVHYRELGLYSVSPDQLRDSCVNTYVAAWLLAKKTKKYGNTWTAIGAYHSETPVYRDKYIVLIRKVLVSWQITE